MTISRLDSMEVFWLCLKVECHIHGIEASIYDEATKIQGRKMTVAKVSNRFELDIHIAMWLYVREENRRGRA